MRPQHPTINLNIGDMIHGFSLKAITPLPQIASVAYRFEHEKSGARLLHLYADDPENLFAAAFRTPPPDDTGLPHILEHSVLCGSKKYPVKDPFATLLQISLATFLNAMTYPDKTVYPCASMNERDFFNLMGVYCDAVFEPRITEMFFKQEGHHFDFAEPGNVQSPLIIKGIVYNEMKGNYSDLDGIMFRNITTGVCPDNAYGKDSGGDPDAIPSLTYEQFVEFHRTYYHPSNSLLFLYGNIASNKSLEFLDQEYLSRFERIEINTRIAPQPRWQEPRRQTISYPVGANEDTTRKTAVTITFLANDLTDAVTTLAMQVLDHYLLSNAASPLRKALIDSRLGQELTQAGYMDHQRDTLFTAGLKGTEPDAAEKIEALVKQVCADQVTQGLDRSKVEAAIHRYEMAAKEIQSAYPLRLMDRVYNSWLYDADPLHNLRLNDHLLELRRRFESEPGFLEGILEKFIVKNPHYKVDTFVPDKEYSTRRETEFRKLMADRKAAMTPEELESIRREAEELAAMQSHVNTPEELATLPRLSRADVPEEPYELPVSREEVAGRPCLFTDTFSNGVNYIQLAFDLSGLEDGLWDYVPLFCEAMTKMGAAGLDYVAMAEREAACSGGVGASANVAGRVDDALHVQPFIMVQSKALDRKLEEMLSVLHDRLTAPDFTDLDRLRDVILQGRIHRRASIIPAGNMYSTLYAGRHLSRNGRLNERLGGVTQIKFFDKLAENFDQERDRIVHKLEAIARFLRVKERLYASFVGDTECRTKTAAWLGTALSDFREESIPQEDSAFNPAAGTAEGIATPADVAFVAAVMQAVGAAHELAPALLLLSTNLSYGFLWNEIRAKRGAYGGHARYQAANGIFAFSSYRDPCIGETLQTYAQVFEHIDRQMDLSASAIEQAVIGTLKTIDKPIRPSQAVGVTLARFLSGDTPEFHRDFRMRLLGLTSEDVRRAAADILAPAFDKAAVCVLSSREKLDAANTAFPAINLAIETL